MTEFTLPVSNWLEALADAVKTAKEDDVIVVNSEAKAELVRVAMRRLGRQVNVVVRH